MTFHQKKKTNLKNYDKKSPGVFIDLNPRAFLCNLLAV